MPQYILREFKVTDARVSVGRESWQILESRSCCTGLEGAFLVEGRSKGPGVESGPGGWVTEKTNHSQHQTGRRERRVPVSTPQCAGVGGESGSPGRTAWQCSKRGGRDVPRGGAVGHGAPDWKRVTTMPGRGEQRVGAAGG